MPAYGIFRYAQSLNHWNYRLAQDIDWTCHLMAVSMRVPAGTRMDTTDRATQTIASTPHYIASKVDTRGIERARLFIFI
jgi:hypothetical protein